MSGDVLDELDLLAGAMADNETVSDVSLRANTEPYNSFFPGLSLDRIEPDPNQPRKVFKDMEDLQASILATVGVIQPIIIRPHPESKKREQGVYMIIAGERRWRASCNIEEIDTIPAVVRDVSEEAVRFFQVIENKDRDDLTTYEEAISIYNLCRDYDGKVVAERLGKSPSWVSKIKRILDVEEVILNLIKNENIEDPDNIHLLNKIYLLSPESASVFIGSPKNIKRSDLKKTWNALKRTPANDGSQEPNTSGTHKSEQKKPTKPKEKEEHKPQTKTDQSLPGKNSKDEIQQTGTPINSVSTRINITIKLGMKTFHVDLTENPGLGKVYAIDESGDRVEFDCGTELTLVDVQF